MVLYLLDVGRIVHDPEFLARRAAGFERHCDLGGGRVVDPGEDRGEPLGALRVPSPGGVCCEFLMSPEQHYHSTTVPPARSMRGGLVALATTRGVPGLPV